ncbi:Mu transposase domain-containing protein [Collinsella aerofaciens]|uniref:Mu transposase domain-containing protein n=1 Tax=Collinsella aerofaciens TaxID=74426 RepID=UPI003F83F968
MREHEAACSANTRPLEVTAEVERYLCPRRKISFDGFVSFEGHRYGVPYWYVRRECRVNREGRVVHIYSDDLSRELVAHAVGTGADSWCEGSGRHRRRSPRSCRPSRWGPWSSKSPRPGRNPVSRGSTSGGPNDGGRGGEPLRARRATPRRGSGSPSGRRSSRPSPRTSTSATGRWPPWQPPSPTLRRRGGSPPSRRC